jgi:hypothetical protein
MKKSIFIMLMGLFALLGNSFAQIKLWNNGGIAIGDTTDPGSEKTVFYDDVEFTGNVTGIIFPDSVGGSDNLFDNGTSSYFTGKLGIGTAGPTTNLQVDGTLASPANVRISNLGGSWTPQQVIGQFSFHTTDASGVGARDLAVIKGISATGGTTQGGELAFFTSVHNSSTLKEVMRLDDAGFVGIGTQTPTEQLHLKTLSGTSCDIVLEEDGKIWRIRKDQNGDYLRLGYSTDLSSFTNHVHIGTTGNVGFGVASPSAEFHLYGATSKGHTNFRIESQSNFDANIQLYSNSVQRGVIGWDESASALKFNYGDFSGSGLSINSSGYVGVGTSSPLRPLTVSTNGYMQMWEAPTGTANAKKLSLYCNSGTDIFRFIKTLDNGGYGSDILSMDLGSQYVGIKDPTPSFNLDVNGTGRFTGLLRADAGLSTYGGNTSIYSSVETDTRLTLDVASGSLAKIYYYDQGDTQFQDLRIGSSSTNNGLYYDASTTRIGINDDTPSYTLDVNGTGRFTGTLTASSLSLSSGLSVSSTASFYSHIMAYHDLTVYGTFTNMSDRTLKTDILPLEVNSLEKVIRLQGMTYRFINDEERIKRTGFIAQDVQKIFPELVSETEEGLGIKTLEIIPHIVEAIKEQQILIEEQQRIIADLDARLQALEGK